MLLQEIFDRQKRLDACFQEKAEINAAYSFDKKLVALLVEIGEFLNEMEMFKYWKLNKKTNNSAKILEEFADGLHFLASIGVELQYKPFDIPWVSDNSDDISLIRELVHNLSDFFQPDMRNAKLYEKLARNYFQIIINNGFAKTEVLDAFFAKNDLNFIRARENY